MKSLFFILAVCISLCVAQNVDVDENGSSNSEDCRRVCLRRGRCPTATGIIRTIQWLPNQCRMCINKNCGSPGNSNRTETAECMFATRLTCDNCRVTSGVRRYHENCMMCLATCGQSNEGDNENATMTASSTSRKQNSRSPFRSHFSRSRSHSSRSRSQFHRQRGHSNRFVSRFQVSRQFSISNRTVCSCVPPTPCLRRHQIQTSMRQFSRQCRRCVFQRCQHRTRGSSRSFSRCVVEARSDCTHCPNVTRATQEQMTNCRRCVRRCRTFQIRVPTFVRRRPSNLCGQNCVASSYCPSTSAIIATVNRFPSACQMCIREACGSPTNESRNEVAQCMFETRPNCAQCQMTSVARRQRERCTMCRRQCSENAGRSATTMPTPSPSTVGSSVAMLTETPATTTPSIATPDSTETPSMSTLVATDEMVDVDEGSGDNTIETIEG